MSADMLKGLYPWDPKKVSPDWVVAVWGVYFSLLQSVLLKLAEQCFSLSFRIVCKSVDGLTLINKP